MSESTELTEALLSGIGVGQIFRFSARAHIVAGHLVSIQASKAAAFAGYSYILSRSQLVGEAVYPLHRKVCLANKLSPSDCPWIQVDRSPCFPN